MWKVNNIFVNFSHFFPFFSLHFPFVSGWGATLANQKVGDRLKQTTLRLFPLDDEKCFNTVKVTKFKVYQSQTVNLFKKKQGQAVHRSEVKGHASD